MAHRASPGIGCLRPLPGCTSQRRWGPWLLGGSLRGPLPSSHLLPAGLFSFQSMGICFIGKRNFEHFILQVSVPRQVGARPAPHTRSSALTSHLPFSICSLGPGGLFPSRTILFWEHTKVSLCVGTALGPSLVWSPRRPQGRLGGCARPRPPAVILTGAMCLETLARAWPPRGCREPTVVRGAELASQLTPRTMWAHQTQASLGATLGVLLM